MSSSVGAYARVVVAAAGVALGADAALGQYTDGGVSSNTLASATVASGVGNGSTFTGVFNDLSVFAGAVGYYDDYWKLQHAAGPGLAIYRNVFTINENSTGSASNQRRGIGTAIVSANDINSSLTRDRDIGTSHTTTWYTFGKGTEEVNLRLQNGAFAAAGGGYSANLAQDLVVPVALGSIQAGMQTFTPGAQSSLVVLDSSYNVLFDSTFEPTGPTSNSVNLAAGTYYVGLASRPVITGTAKQIPTSIVDQTLTAVMDVPGAVASSYTIGSSGPNPLSNSFDVLDPSGTQTFSMTRTNPFDLSWGVLTVNVPAPSTAAFGALATGVLAARRRRGRGK